jgi:hypothetical protein
MMLFRRNPLLRLLAAAGVFGLWIDDPAGGGGGGNPPQPETFSKDYVRELREENKGWRLKASEAETAAKAAKDAATAAEAAAAAKTAEVTSAADQRVIRAELKAAALKAGMVDLDGLKLADLSTVKLNADGEVEGADALMDAMKKAKPYLFGPPSSSNGGKPPPPTPPATKKAADMTDAEYKAAKAELLRG